MNDYQKIISILVEHRRLKKVIDSLRAELIKEMVENLCFDQDEAKKMDVITFWDGFLSAKGFIQDWRIKK